MNNPALAMIWYCWRLSRRWVLIWTLVCFAMSYFVLNAMPVNIPPFAIHEGLTMICFVIASLNGLATMSLWNQTGFPFQYQFHQPIRSVTLVVLPLLFLCLACAAIFALPMTVFAFIYVFPMPPFAAVTLIALQVMMLVSVFWSTTTSAGRVIGIIAVLTGYPVLFSLLDPFDFQTRRVVGNFDFDRNLITLESGEYLCIAVFMALLSGLVVKAVDSQRHGDNLQLWPSARRGDNRSGLAGKGPLLDKISDLCNMRCPVSAPWKAEVWLEYKRFSFPALLLSLLMALLVPVLILLETELGLVFTTESAFLTPILAAFTVVGIALFNRRSGHGGYMNVFEASRGLGTVQLMVIQLGMTTLSLVLSLAIVGLSLWACWAAMPMETNLFVEQAGKYLAAFSGVDAAGFLVTVFLKLSGLMILVACFCCFHACAVFWGRFFAIALLIAMMYMLYLITNIGFNNLDLATLDRNLWGFATAALLVTLGAGAAVARRRVLGWRGALVIGGLWGAYLLARLYDLQRSGEVISAMPGAFLAYHLALGALPLLLGLACIVCYDKLRHG